ncbi:hypothetical protein [Leptolyngbya sp. BC1307]|uniref:hypothetical protein n=1 Tax=Leptolyngbya sp. BC1307 TaxID=2029589 RepID=UPI000EFA5CD4|nr:hypothetical protein [Leptolyngbya sp. BC1307]
MPTKTLRNKHLDPALWGLSKQAIKALNNEPTILQSLAADRLLPPLPPGYVPKVIEVLFDDVPYIRTEDGVVTRLRECLEDYQPSFIEYRFDDEVALFQIGGEIIINRIEGIAKVSVLQDLLK